MKVALLDPAVHRPTVPAAMLQSFILWANQWGNVIGVVGFALSILGFIATLWGVYKSKNAAERAADAVKDVRASIIFIDTVSELSAAITTMEEIKRLQRVGAWQILPDRYASLRQRLIRIHSSNDAMSAPQKQDIQRAISQFARFEAKLDNASAKNMPPPNPAKLNQLVSSQIDRLEAVLRDLQRLQRA